MDEKNSIFDVGEYVKDMVFVVRDCNLSPAIADKYQVGMILKERWFVDATYIIGGMITSHRFTILSNQFMDLSKFDESKKGLCVTNRDSRFKVIDKYTVNGKTQITLLHLPDDEHWKDFRDFAYIVEKKIALVARKRFEFMLGTPVIETQNTPEFLDRFSFPLGISDDGTLFPVD